MVSTLIFFIIKYLMLMIMTTVSKIRHNFKYVIYNKVIYIN